MYFDSTTGMVYGDLAFVDLPTAIKLSYGAKFGISPSIAAYHDNRVVKKFNYKNFGVVINPAMKTNYINNSVEEVKEDGGNVMEEKLIETLEATKKVLGSFAERLVMLESKANEIENKKDIVFDENKTEPIINELVLVVPTPPEPVKIEPVKIETPKVEPKQELVKPELVKIDDTEVKNLQDKVRMLEEKLKDFAKPVVDAKVTGTVKPNIVVTTGIDEFIKYVKGLEKK
jgi:hypothetical protein